MDCTFVAIKAALVNCRLPVVSIRNGEIDVVRDGFQSVPLPHVDSYPISVTVCAIRNGFCIDPRAEEVNAGDMLIHILCRHEIMRVCTTNGGLCSSLLLKNMVSSCVPHALKWYHDVNETLSKL